VPLHDRLRYMLAFRGAVALAVVAAWFLLPEQRGLSLPAMLLIAGGYLTATVATLRIARLERKTALRVFAVMLLLDAVWLALVSYATAGFGTPVQYVVLLHLVAVTLLASFRSGMKLAVWHSLLVSAVVELQTDGLLRGGAPPPGTVVPFLVVVWAGALATASFAAVNERELRRRNFDLQALAKLSWQLESALHPHEVGEALVAAAARDFDIPRMALLVRSKDGLTVLAGRGLHEVDAHGPADDRLIAQSLREHRTLRLLAPRADQHPWLSRALPDAGNVLCVPLYSDGNALGALLLEVSASRGARIERRTVEMLERFVSQAALALTNARLLAQLHALAAADGLTGVANRRAFDARLAEEIARATRSGSPLSLVLFDVDHFKRLNDTYGHQTGDETLQRVAATLSSAARAADLVARYGGEEFVLLLPDTDLAAAGEAAERLRIALAAMPGQPQVTVSLGVASFPATSLGAGELVAAADEALYAAKQAGRNRVMLTTRRSPSSLADFGGTAGTAGSVGSVGTAGTAGIAGTAVPTGGVA
jgi:diguanylate cyclase (GGDEF)-like protein